MSDPYHMIGYIHEIPRVLGRTLMENEDHVREMVAAMRHQSIDKIVLVGVGSSYTAGLMALPLFRKHSGLATYLFAPSELGPCMPELVGRHSLVICISRSGERGGVVDALQDSVRLGAYAIALTGTSEGLLAQNAPHVLVTSEGPEITFAKTKSVATCTALLMRLALEFASPEDTAAIKRLQDLNSSPSVFGEVMSASEPYISQLVLELQPHKALMVAGTASNLGAAFEFGIKLQEAANVPVICNDMDNLLHGAWGPVDPEWLTLLLVTSRDVKLSRKVLELAGKLRGHRMVIREPGLPTEDLSDFTITLPRNVDIYTAGLFSLAPLQLLTYHWALAKGFNPDAPAGMRVMLDAMLPPGREEPEFRTERDS